MIRQAGANNANCSIGNFLLCVPPSLLLESLRAVGEEGKDRLQADCRCLVFS